MNVMTSNYRRVLDVLVLLGFACISIDVGAQYAPRRNSGNNVAPVFEGWEKNPDGSFSMVFGYLNRNYEEQPEIPIGPNNNISPGPLDQGQPTHFYNRRQQFMFKVRVPADFGKQDLVWTLTRNGKTEKAYGSLTLEYELSQDVWRSNRGGIGDETTALNETPTISIERGNRTVPVGRVLTLVALVSDDGLPTPPPPAPAGAPAAGAAISGNASALVTNRAARPSLQAVVKPNRAGLAVTWTHWRGPGQVTFDPPTALAKPANGMPATKVTFSQPGTYVIRAYADDGALTTPADVTITVTGVASASSDP